MLHIVYSIQYLQLKPYVRMWPKTTLTTLKFKILWQVVSASPSPSPPDSRLPEQLAYQDGANAASISCAANVCFYDQN